MDFLKSILSKKTLDALTAKFTPEALAEINKQLGDFKINPSEEQFIPKAVFDAERQKIADLDNRIKERDTQLEELKKTAGDSQKLQDAIKEMQTANTAAKMEYESRIAKIARDYALSDALKNTYKARDVASVLPHLKQEAILFADGKFTGLEEQIKTVKAEKGFLFESEASPAPGTGGAPGYGSPQGESGSWNFNFTPIRGETKK